MTSRFTLPAFAAYGIELEYAIVRVSTLDIAPVAESILASLDHNPPRPGRLSGWSNELVSHVIELKNVEPIPSLVGLPDEFQREVHAVNRALRAFEARLMPSGMHPWMDPRIETTIWRASDAAIYATYDRLFDCRRHGWANLQSMHINLPFADDLQFARLHTAIRLVLPLIPALAASSPIAEGAATAYRDYRLAMYATHANRFPSITGEIVPDVIGSRREYEHRILSPMYEAIAKADPQRVLRHEWLNARGAIARFDRGALEIRLADVQECPHADIAIAHAVCSVVQALFQERRSSACVQEGIETTRLARLLLRTMRDGEDAVIDDGGYFAALGLSARRRSARAAWRELLDHADAEVDRVSEDTLSHILSRGTLASRLLRRLGQRLSPPRLHEVYAELCDCLDEGRLFS